MRHNYGAIARQGGTTVNGGAQLLFVLKNPLRYIAVLLGTLYENDGFIGQLGLFGWKDMPVAFISLTAPLVLLAAALLCSPSADALGRRRTGWLSAFGLVYAVGAMTAMYITYTPWAWCASLACRRGISCRCGCWRCWLLPRWPAVRLPRA